jgi:streptomycin 6-kinase
MIVVPRDFVNSRIRASGVAGRRWTDALPDLIARLSTRWQVELLDSAPLCGAFGVVAFGVRAGEPCVLKVSWHEHSTLEEATALRAWRGYGAVRLLEASFEDGALLLERLDPGRSLEDLDLPQAAEILGSLLRRLAIPAPDGLRSLSGMAADLVASMTAQQAALRDPVPDAWFARAVTLAGDLGASAGTDLVHVDLHFGNVLAGVREPWLAIDPWPIAGDPERAIPELLFSAYLSQFDAADVYGVFDRVVRAGNLDPQKARAWTVVRAVDHWLWSVAAGRSPRRCQELLELLG